MPNPTLSDIQHLLTRPGVRVQGFNRPKELDSFKGTVSVWLPLVLVNTLNRREHWAVRSRRTMEHRSSVMLKLTGIPKPTRPVVVKMVRLYSGRAKAYDSDGLVCAFKACRDGVADAYGCDDSAKSGLRFEYEQVRAEANVVNILIRPEDGMNYEPNTAMHKPGDLILHDSDAKRPDMLMRFIKYDKAFGQTEYVDPELQKKWGGKRSRLWNPNHLLHEASRFNVTLAGLAGGRK